MAVICLTTSGSYHEILKVGGYESIKCVGCEDLDAQEKATGSIKHFVLLTSDWCCHSSVLWPQAAPETGSSEASDKQKDGIV